MIGEPSGTAGAPMLNILVKKELENVLIIVTRYFGGILLGTGGLVRAYSDTAKLALEKSEEIIKEEGFLVEIISGYENISEIEYIFLKNNIEIVKKEYGENIKLLIEISERKFEENVKKNIKMNFQNIPVEIIKKRFVVKK